MHDIEGEEEEEEGEGEAEVLPSLVTLDAVEAYMKATFQHELASAAERKKGRTTRTKRRVEDVDEEGREEEAEGEEAEEDAEESRWPGIERKR